MSGEQPEKRQRTIPPALVPWLIPMLIVILVVAAVDIVAMAAVALIALGVIARLRYVEVRRRELAGGPQEWERWRTDSMLRRAAERYDNRG